MRTCIIVNPRAGTAYQSDLLSSATRFQPEIECWTSDEAGHAIDLARKAAEEEFDCVAAAGGDGTINEVVNGIMQAETARPRLGIIPLGTGNDLARTLAIPSDPRDAVALMHSQAPSREIDLFCASTAEKSRYAINAAAGGFSGQVDEALTEEMKKDWGPLAFLIGAARAIPDMQDFRTRIRINGGIFEDSELLNVIVANGRTVAGGHRVAPRANPCDGLLDVALVSWGTMLDLADVGTRLLAGDYLDSEHVTYRQAKRIEISSEPGMWFNVDGELFTNDPITFEVQPAAIRVTCGEDFSPDPTLALGQLRK